MIPASWAAAPNCAMELPSGDDEELLLLSDDDGTTLELPSCDDGAHPGGASSSQGIAKRKAAPFAESPHLRGRQRTLAIATGIGAGRKPSSSNLRRGSHTARRELMQGSACSGSAWTSSRLLRQHHRSATSARSHCHLNLARDGAVQIVPTNA